jgi:peptidyl-prolyl cis-trans isomerase SurA
MMKKIIVLLLIFTGVQSTFAQKDAVIMEIDGKPVTKSEFLQIYLKNNPNPKFDKASLDEYVEMFTKFKLKVAEAEKLGYDTIPKLKKELDGYRKQLALPYLIDSVENQAMVAQAYDRIKNEVRASHMLIRVDANASPKDTLAAYNKIMALKARIEKGEDFAAVAKMKNGSEDPSAVSNGGDLGFFTAFQMVYPFEEKAFTTAIGQVSDPFRTRYGYHIVKVTDKRPSRGTIRVAHIMVSTGKDATNEAKGNAEKKINEIYDKLSAGEKWESLVSLHSDDANSVKKNGELPAFGSGTTQRMVPAFEDAAFALKEVGQISKPVKTDFGYHIIKLIEWKEVSSFESMKKELQTKVNKDERSKKTQDAFVSKLKANYQYAYKGDKNLKWFNEHLDSTYYLGKWSADGQLKSNKVMFELNGVTADFTQQEFARFLEKNYRGVKRDENKAVIAKQYKSWEKAAILQYEESVLPAKYPEYKALLKEYHDGIILYEIMQDRVWNKAVKDTSGLRAYFNANQTKYTWQKRLDATVYECLNIDIAKSVSGMLKNDTINSKHVLDVINKDSELNLKVKMNKFDIAQTPYLANRNFSKGVNAAYEFEGKYYVVKVAAVLEPVMKEFSEAKGMATSDYQNYLEATWIESLKNTHTVKVNQDVLYQIGN